MPDKWQNGITAIISLFTQTQNEFLLKHVRQSFVFFSLIQKETNLFCFVLA